MKVAVPAGDESLDNPVCSSFGRAPFFVLYDTESGDHEFMNNSAAADQGGAGIKAAQALADAGAGVVVACRCGENAAQVLNAAKIGLYRAQDGTVHENIEKYKSGRLDILSQTHPGFHTGGSGA